MSDELNYKRLEVLVTLANNPNGLKIEEFVENGLRLSAEYLVKKGYLVKTTIHPKLVVTESIDPGLVALLGSNIAPLTVTASIGQTDSCLGYKINQKGEELVKKILEYVNDNVLVEFRYI